MRRVVQFVPVRVVEGLAQEGELVEFHPICPFALGAAGTGIAWFLGERTVRWHETKNECRGGGEVDDHGRG